MSRSRSGPRPNLFINFAYVLKMAIPIYVKNWYMKGEFVKIRELTLVIIFVIFLKNGKFWNFS